MPNYDAVDVAVVPTSAGELLDSERAFVSAMHQLWFGRFECLRIANGELLLDPWPSTVREVKFESDQQIAAEPRREVFELKHPGLGGHSSHTLHRVRRDSSSGDTSWLAVFYGTGALSEMAFDVSHGCRSIRYSP